MTSRQVCEQCSFRRGGPVLSMRLAWRRVSQCPSSSRRAPRAGAAGAGAGVPSDAEPQMFPARKLVSGHDVEGIVGL
eukprot:CAMPEP_0185272936 /NCGR_PEP_ID=MMETSP1359-20130426/48440_1 /TAXON_ID=552665 /ORGANISM="Bigelowiella longifila, Strain CCMP242" /LENGTH=76 /DNA_ID=CAMNT_0027865405 /DNA_START=547 /DNA_END=777 /DNA_ORIENTATION=+